MQLTPEVLHNEILYNSLTQLGNCYALNTFLDIKTMHELVEPYKSHWKPYNPRKSHIPREGLSLTSLDGGFSGVPDLDSLMEYNRENGTQYNETSFRAPTPLLKSDYLSTVLGKFIPHLGRSHLIRLHAGGYFPFHRDSAGLGMASTFRLIALLEECGAGRFCFLYDNQRLNLELGHLYFLNTKVEHALFSFGADATLLVLNVILSEDSVKLVVDNLRAT
jgi:hypothetical protein